MANLKLPKEMIDTAHKFGINLSGVARLAVQKEIERIEAEMQPARIGAEAEHA